MEKRRFIFQSFVLDNGLRVVLHQDDSLPLAHVVTRYGVGTRDEGEGEREMAHLYEHMMFAPLEEVEDVHGLLLQPEPNQRQVQPMLECHLMTRFISRQSPRIT